ncbi:DNA recombination protein RmuC [Rhodanobacter sp. PCA2]|uniref:DNA recombination protein RmuC n=1 Tax=Rhodanobacter sp. PCA2 TaxID=2006117 RepID=UPI0015E7B411|nr:DNA recombination protein RmuC [Rhodanobacter sp. PCA2]MBA2079390.1 DNA recombination protein RmuC [Rhodanobacter sp. PCA2]
MPSSETLLIVLVVLALLLLGLQLALLLRGRGDAGLHARLDALKDDNERLQRALREEQRSGREELQQGFERFRGHVTEQLGGMSRQQAERIDGFGQRLDALTARTDDGLKALGQRLADDAHTSRDELAQTLERFGQQQQQRLVTLTERTDEGLKALAQRLAENAHRSREELTQTLARFGEQQQQRFTTLGAQHEQRMGEVRGTLDGQLKTLREDNAAQLEKMRATVDEKLQSTLETRLGQSFQLVSERLEQVQRGLGEMQSLATGVGDLKRVLGNVKTRGILGEVQLGALLEQLLTPDQYAANVAVVPNSDARVEYAVHMPNGVDNAPLWLSIDAKFPLEDYQRLQQAQEDANAPAAMEAANALERRVREEAKRIRSKYIVPPHTVDFAILFLPTEGLFAEVLRRPGLFEALQREHHITVAGPTTLAAILTSLKAGFRTLAIEKRSSEVWRLLGAVKTEFGKFGMVLDKVKKNLDQASNQIDATGVRTRQIERKLRGVETLPGELSQQLLETPAESEESDEPGAG